jgi:hypothetical protein
MGTDGLASGLYTFTISDAGNNSSSIDVQINEPPAFLLAFNSTAIGCPGDSNGSAAVLPSGGTPPYTYLWSNNAPDSLITGLSAGSYTVTVTDANGCQRIAGVNLSSIDSLSYDVQSQLPLCFDDANGTLIVSPHGGTPPFIINWWNGVSGDTLSNIPAGNHPFSITDANGCEIQNIATLGQPEPMWVAFEDTPPLCEYSNDGQVIAIGNGGTPPYQYSWDNGQQGDTLDMIPVGLYYVSITDANNCMGVFPYVTPLPLSISIDFYDVIHNNCSYSEEGQIEVFVSGGEPPISYHWNTGDTTSTISNLPSGDYTLTITDANFCVDSFTLEVIAPNEITAELSSTVATVNGSDGTASVVNANGGTPPYSYLWSTGATTEAINGLNPDVYQLTITDHVGCEASFSILVELISATHTVYKNTIAIPVYPNPSGGRVVFELPRQECEVQIYNGHGSLVKNLLSAGFTEVELNMPDGLYFYKIRMGGIVLQTGKLVKQAD